IAFPTIMPAALTFLQQQEDKDASRTDLRGAIFGSLGLIAFAIVLIPTATRLPGAAALALSVTAWFSVSFLAWKLLHECGPWKDADGREERGADTVRGQSSRPGTKV